MVVLNHKAVEKRSERASQFSVHRIKLLQVLDEWVVRTMLWLQTDYLHLYDSINIVTVDALTAQSLMQLPKMHPTFLKVPGRQRNVKPPH